MDSHRKTIDAVQDIAVALTDPTMQFQSLAFKHADEVRRAIAVVRPVLGKIPGLNLADNSMIARADDVSQAIASSAGSTERVLHEIKDALVASDPALIREYIVRVAALRERATQLPAASHVSSPTMQAN